jgi:hypothetical protein
MRTLKRSKRSKRKILSKSGGGRSQRKRIRRRSKSSKRQKRGGAPLFGRKKAPSEGIFESEARRATEEIKSAQKALGAAQEAFKNEWKHTLEQGLEGKFSARVQGLLNAILIIKNYLAEKDPTSLEIKALKDLADINSRDGVKRSQQLLQLQTIVNKAKAVKNKAASEQHLKLTLEGAAGVSAPVAKN